jgi:hypothetical protein
MKFRHALYMGLLIAILVVAGCSSPTPTTVPGTEQPADTPVAQEPTATKAAQVATAAPEPGEIPMGFTEEGFPYRGDPNATVTLYEYSDFT